MRVQEYLRDRLETAGTAQKLAGVLVILGPQRGQNGAQTGDSGSNIEPKWVRNRPRVISEIIENPMVFIAFSASGGSKRRPEMPLQKENIIKNPLVFITFS